MKDKTDTRTRDERIMCARLAMAVDADDEEGDPFETEAMLSCLVDGMRPRILYHKDGKTFEVLNGVHKEVVLGEDD